MGLIPRIWASIQGGQFFIVDELRYNAGHHLISQIFDFQYAEALKYFLSNSAHTFFTLFAAIAEVARYLALVTFYDSNIKPYELNLSDIGIEVSSCVLSISSAINIVLVYLVVISFGGTKSQSLMASFLMLLSTSNFYFSRHLVPYDLAITFSLLSLYFSGKVNSGPRNAILCGFFSGISTLTYFGYWVLSFTIWLCCILRSSKKKNLHLKNALLCGTAGVSILFFLQAFGMIVNINFLDGLINFTSATSTNQMGDLGSGFSIFLEYLWHSENIVFVFLLCFFLLSLWKSDFLKTKLLNQKSVGLFCTITIFSLLIFLSDFLESFVLYGRTIKQIVPFLCISCSLPLCLLVEKLLREKKVWILGLLIFTLVASSISNHLKVLNVVYPNDLKKQAQSVTKHFDEIGLFEGENVEKLEKKVSNSSHILVNAQHLVPPLKLCKTLPKGKVILEEKHPYFAFKPYQYLHFNCNERQLIDQSKTSMYLLEYE